MLGELEEGFLESLMPGDTFLFGGEVLALQGIVENEALVSRCHADTPQVPSYAGGKFPLSTYLASRVRDLLPSPRAGAPCRCRWPNGSACRPTAPPCRRRTTCWSRRFRAADGTTSCAIPFEGRLAHQTLGMLLTRRMERGRLKPLGFVANDYALAIWAKSDVGARMANGLVLGGRALRGGHARRRPGGMAAGIRPDEAHLPPLRHRSPG